MKAEAVLFCEKITFYSTLHSVVTSGYSIKGTTAALLLLLT
jgi:hypothetical protein